MVFLGLPHSKRLRVHEMLQYFLSDAYGVGKFRHAGKKVEAPSTTGEETPPLAYKIQILDSSLILPRSSKNHDMACVELPKGLIYNSRHQNSFAMPTATATNVDTNFDPDL